MQYMSPICHDTGILNIWLKIVTVRHLEQRWEGLEVRHVEHGPCVLKLVPSEP